MTIPENATDESLSANEGLKTAFEASILEALKSNGSVAGGVPADTTVRVESIEAATAGSMVLSLMAWLDAALIVNLGKISLFFWFLRFRVF